MLTKHGLGRVVAAGAILVVGSTALARENLTPQEAARPSEQWTLEQFKAKGWTPYECWEHGAPGPRAPWGTRWPMNDPAGPALGTCVTFSFMGGAIAMEAGEGPNTWPAGMPAGSAGEVTIATGTWAASADIHFTLVADGGGPWNGPGPASLKGNLRIGSGAIPGGGVLAHGYYPPPNGVSAAGDVHFDDLRFWAWVTAGAPLHPAGGPPYDVQTVSLHELGHALGLDHVGTVVGDVMFGAYTGEKRALAAGDIAFMTGIYGPVVAGHTPQCVGACCHSSKVCSMKTQAACTALGFNWRGVGTQCPAGSNVRTAQHASGPVTHWADPSLDCNTISRGGGTGGCLPGIPIDSWETSEDQQTCHNFGPFPESPPIPQGFFEEASFEFQGEVCLQGQPVGPTSFGEYGEADTLILRSVDPFDRCELPSAQERTVDIEIVALSLVSIAPIAVDNPIFGFSLWDVAVDLSPNGPPSTSIMQATKEHCNGGTYSSFLAVQPRFLFIKRPDFVGDPTVPAGTVRELDTGLWGLPPIVLQQAGRCDPSGLPCRNDLDCPLTESCVDVPVWAHDLDPYLNLNSAGEGCTEFHPGIEDTGQNTACDCNTNGVRDDCDIRDCPAGDLACADCNANGIPDECDPDLDGDGIPDDCDTCPDTPNPDQSSICAAATADSFASCATHDPNGNEGPPQRKCIDILAAAPRGVCDPRTDTQIEPRFLGSNEIDIVLSASPVAAVTVSASCTDGSTPTAASLAFSGGGTKLTATFNPALPNTECCTISLIGGATGSQVIKTLNGDVNGSGRVNATDKNIVKGKVTTTTPPLSCDEFFYDVNVSGRINATDKNLVKGKITTQNELNALCP
ncbi:MAG: matrixin family metalloprotease [bacterium]|nr:matrixin family metalloprotease [bacterium]